MALAPGAQLGAYRIVSILGAGGMGEVYRAHDSRLGRDVALKILPDTLASNPGALARFEREARAVAALNHPHIVTIFSTEEAQGARFLTMEMVEGQTLDQLIREGLSLPQFFEIAAALADALDAAHKKHIIHRDLKPANVMVTPDRRVKVLDFGLARTHDDSPGLAETDTLQALTVSGMVVGTAPYMSPEQIEAKPIDHRSDLFSLGVVMYEMLSGRRPFGGVSSVSMMSSTLRDDPRPLNDGRPGTPEGVSRLIARCLEKAARDRVQTAHEVLVELRTLQRVWESGPVAGRPAPAPAPASAPAQAASIAVLPFRDMSAAKDQDWFCDGIAEEILNALAPLQGLRVAARTSAFSFKGKSDDLRTIGDKLNVATVLEGSVRRAGDRVRITVQLSSVRDGYQLWSERYDRGMEDIFDVQDEIAKAIATKMAITLGSGEHERLVSQGTANIEAYQLYLRGRALLVRRGTSIPPALELLRQAVALDPGYSLAWASIAEGFTVLVYFGFIRSSESRPQAIGAATRAIELDPLSAAAHTALAAAVLIHDNNVTLARQEFERALELNPDYVFGRQWYALFFLQWACGEFDRGVEEARRALASDPLSAFGAMILSASLFTAGQLDEAAQYGRLAVERDPQSFVAYWALGAALGFAGRLDEAREVLAAGAAISGRHSLALQSLASACARAGQQAEAESIYRELVDRSARTYLPFSAMIVAADAAGHRDEAMALARQAWEAREPSFVLFARHFPEFRTLHSDSRFAAILQEMNA